MTGRGSLVPPSAPLASPKEWVMNDLAVDASRMQGSVATPLVTPYPYPEWSKEALKALLEGVVDFGEIRRLVTGPSPELLLGAVEVGSGEFEVFRDAELTVEKVLPPPRSASRRLSQAVFVSTRPPRSISVPTATISAVIGFRSFMRSHPRRLSRRSAQSTVAVATGEEAPGHDERYESRCAWVCGAS